MPDRRLRFDVALERLASAVNAEPIRSHLDREMEFVGRVAANEGFPPVERAAAVLVIHQRLSPSSCLCGWSELGHSFSGHQAEELDALGILKAGDSE